MSLYITDDNGKLHKLAGAGGGAGSTINVDSELNAQSENPVQNKVITEELNNRYTKSEVDDLLSDIETGGGSAESELVAEVTLTEASQEITFNNLDIADDGGIYDFVLTVPYVAETYVYMKINNITSGYASIITTMIYYSTGKPESNLINAQNKNNWEIGYNFGDGSCVGTITLNNGVVSCHTKYYAKKEINGVLITTSGQVNASNITSITFGTVVGGGPAFPVGTIVKIFKRDTNVQTRS